MKNNFITKKSGNMTYLAPKYEKIEIGWWIAIGIIAIGLFVPIAIPTII